MNKLEEILHTPDDSVIEYFLDVDLTYPVNVKEKTKNFLLCPQNKIIPRDKYNEYMKKIKAKTYTKAKKLNFDWSDKKNF